VSIVFVLGAWYLVLGVQSTKYKVQTKGLGNLLSLRLLQAKLECYVNSLHGRIQRLNMAMDRV
jgi:hypothetical protein